MNYQIQRAQHVVDQSKKLLNMQAYIDSKKNRQELAGFYKEVMFIGANYPERPVGMNVHIATMLNKRISKTCPACVKPAKMKEYIKKAVEYIQNYAVVLQKWIDDQDKNSNLSSNVHDLEPNI